MEECNPYEQPAATDRSPDYSVNANENFVLPPVFSHRPVIIQKLQTQRTAIWEPGIDGPVIATCMASPLICVPGERPLLRNIVCSVRSAEAGFFPYSQPTEAVFRAMCYMRQMSADVVRGCYVDEYPWPDLIFTVQRDWRDAMRAVVGMPL